MEEQQRWDIYNQFALWGELDRYTKLLARYELFKLIADKPGDIIEGGVLKGSGVLFWAKLIQIFNPQSRRKVVGFDTFAGYPESGVKVHDRETAKDFRAVQIQEADQVTAETILKVARDQGLEHRVELVQGDAANTVSNYVKNNPGFRVALLNLDFVLYEPTLAALRNLYPCVVTGGVIALDEYAVRNTGESDAVDEVLNGQPVDLRMFPWSKSPTAYFVK